ncbi:hypothetical protein ACFL0Z_01570 [Patescibacteria group bacterium]
MSFKRAFAKGINIKDIAGSESEAESTGEFKFDSRKEIDDETWNEVRRYLQRWWEMKLDVPPVIVDSVVVSFAPARNLALLFPERKEALGITSKIEDWMKKGLEIASRDPEDKERRKALSIAAGLRLLLPPEKQMALPESLENAARMSLEIISEEQDIEGAKQVGWATRILWPENKDLRVDNETVEKIRAHLNDLRKSPDDPNWEEYADYAAFLFLIGRGKPGEFGVDDEVLAKMEAELQNLKKRGKKWTNITGLAVNILILQAKEIRFSERGMEIIPPWQSSGGRSSELPETKKF